MVFRKPRINSDSILHRDANEITFHCCYAYVGFRTKYAKILDVVQQ